MGLEPPIQEMLGETSLRNCTIKLGHRNFSHGLLGVLVQRFACIRHGHGMDVNRARVGVHIRRPILPYRELVVAKHLFFCIESQVGNTVESVLN